MFLGKSAVCSLLLLGMFCFSAAAQADSAKIGVVDMDRAFSAYDSVKGISERVRAAAREGREERAKLREEINLLEREFREKAENLSREEAERLGGRLQDKVQEYRDFDRLQKERETEPVNEALNHIYEKVEAYAGENGFDLIFEKRVGIFGRTVLFAEERLDITEEIIKQL
jgi:outer membrane protein